jgi:tRNA threonylcarbamoyladenosine biosynthesis protein TsaE
MSGAGRSLVIRTSAAEETRAVGLALAKSLTGSVTLSLEGPLGSGKTVLARGVCEGLGVREPVTSPTYTLQNEYVGREGRRVIHLDCFRLEGPADLEDLDVEDRLDEDTVLLVEWGERALDALPGDVLRIRLEPGEGDERRILIRVPEGVDLPGALGNGSGSPRPLREADAE